MNKLQLAQQIKKHLPLEIIKAEFTSDPDKRNYIVSSQKIYDMGFECHYDLDDGIKQVILWVEENLDDLLKQPLDYIHKS